VTDGYRVLRAREVLDDLDQRIIAALHINPRASWNVIAAVLDASVATVTRRGQKLLESGLVKVIGWPDVARVGFGVPAWLRFKCELGQVGRVARALAEREEVRFVSIVTGPVDCVAEIIIPSHTALVPMLDREIHAIGGITDVETHTVLRTFVYSWFPARFSPDEEAHLGRVVQPYELPSSSAEPDALDDVDLALLAALGPNGRLPLRLVAEMLGISESTVSRRVASLVARGCLYFRCVMDPALVGFDIEFTVWMSVEPSAIEAAATLLSQHPAVRYLSATAGTYDLLAQVAVADQEAIYSFNTQVLGALPGVRQLQELIELQTLARGHVVLDGATPGRAVGMHGMLPRTPVLSEARRRPAVREAVHGAAK
jgi:DNA-binding Lrp family transcriptional regulator